jgi:hypothetical protein
MWDASKHFTFRPAHAAFPTHYLGRTSGFFRSARTAYPTHYLGPTSGFT